MNLRKKLLKNTPKLTALEINGEKYFIREFTVGELNKALYGQQQELIRLAQAQGIELNFNDEEELTKQLAQIYDPYRIARNIAARLCDENGNNLFDPNKKGDLDALSKLDKSTFEQFSQALVGITPKNSPTGADFN
ncbi:hypothetical protein CFY87_03670 [Actinobacillus seminis]|uniref:Phage protein n=1 Tax=Actinobacillus seminis TaxID=722 RepID=A0A263HCR5_9PAST|nr:hypothetical protein [Actinobacillus seminis]OZN25253.1 hypothetical protein CFY87_03670 [Actinobacillus seminis]SUU36030.1 Uncharacterised protein [Actinobacillus seminis]